MNSLNFIRWLKGYVTIELKNENVSSFFSFMLKNGLKVWNIGHKKDTIILNIRAKDYLQIISLRHMFENAPSIRHIGRFGLPFKIKKLIGRKSIAFGFLTFFAVIYILSLFLWSVQIVGNETVSEKQIIDAYSELGIKIGMPKSKIDSYSLRDKLPLLIREISWCSFNVEGTKLTVNISEIKETDKSDKQHYSNLIASSDGIIKQLDIISGNKAVKVGDVVKKGDVLVSGAPVLELQSFSYSKGKIYAETVKKFEIKIDKSDEINIKTGNIKSLRILNIFCFKIPLYLDRIHFDYDSAVNEKKITLWNNELPISLIERTFFEVDKIITQSDYEKALEGSKAELSKELKKYKIAELLSMDYSCSETENCYIFSYICKCIEDIGELSKINVVT